MNPTLSFGLEVKALSNREFEGHGSIFGNVDLGGDVVLPGAFKRTLADHKKKGTMPQMWWMHQPDQVAGAWTDVREDSKGLYVKGELADTVLGNEMRTLLKMKAVRGLSIGYRVVQSDFDREGIRMLKEVNMHEISLVSLGMNPLATVESVKSRLSSTGEYVPSEREFERILRDAGMSRKVARHVCAKVFEEDSETLPDPRRWDAGNEDAETLLKSINGLTDKMFAAAISR